MYVYSSAQLLLDRSTIHWEQDNVECRQRHQQYNCVSDPDEPVCCAEKHGDTHLWVCDDFGTHWEDSATHPKGGVPLKVMQGAGVDGVSIVIPVQN